MTLSTLLRPARRALVALALTATAASAQTPLFTPLDGARISLAPRQTELLNALDAELGVEAIDLVEADARLLTYASEVRLGLPDTEVVLQTLSSTARRSGHVSWIGRAEGSAPGAAWAVLVTRNGQVTGEVHVGGYVYPVRPLTNGLHAVAKKSMADYQTHPDDYATFVADQRPHIESARRAEAASLTASRAAPAATTTIEVIIPYTLDVAAGVADPVALAQSFVDTANLTYINSGVDMELALLYAYEVDYSYSGNMSTDLNRLRNTSDGHLDDVHDVREAYGADLVALIEGTHTSGVCGVGYVNAPSSYGFTVNSSGCSAITFVHEVGHNMGSEHDPSTDSDSDPTDGTNDPGYAPYARGYVNDVGKWGTAMAYNAACTGAACEIVPYLSNPDVFYADISSPIGSGPTGDATVGDNARVHKERMATVAAFRATKAAPSGDVGPAALTLAVVPGGAASGTVELSNLAGSASSPLSWRASLSNVEDPSGTPVPNACTGSETVSQTEFSFYEPNTAGGPETGQSFIAPCSGKLTRVSPAFYGGAAGDWTGTLRIYEGAGTGGTGLASLALSETNPADGSVVYADFDLATPLEVVSGQVYTWFLDLTSGTTRVLYSTVNPYAGGSWYRTTNGNPASASARSSDDAGFALSFAAPDTWASLPDAAGSIAPSASEDITVMVDATGYAEGTYTGDLVLTTNDPLATSITVPITMFVTSVAEHAVVNGFGWRILAVPYEGVTVGTLAEQNYVQGTPDSHPSGIPNLYTSYDGSAWVGASSLSEAAAPGTGIAWYLYDETFAFGPGKSESVALPMALSGPGVEPSSDVDVALHADGDGWNLLGNPFLLDLDVSGADTWGGVGNLQSYVGQVWQCTPNAASPVECVGSYTTTTLLGDTVPAWHGVFFEARAAGAFTIPISARGASLRRTAPRLIAFELASTDSTALDRAAAVVFREGAENGWDGWDAQKLTSLSSPSVQIALGGDRDGEAILKAQDSRPLAPSSFEVPVHVSSQGAGTTLVLTWPRLDDIPDDWTLTLTDLETSEAVDLRTAEAHVFEVAETAARKAAMPGGTGRLGDGPRFTLAIRTANAVGTEEETPADTWLGVPFPNPARGPVAVAYHLAEAGPARLTLVDLLGREVAVLAEGDHAAGQARAEIPTQRLALGLYMVLLEAGGQVQTQRAVVAR